MSKGSAVAPLLGKAKMRATGAAVAAPAPAGLLVSILSLGREDNVLKLLENVPGWLVENDETAGTRSSIVIRNNDPSVAFPGVAARLAALREDLPQLSCRLITGVPNSGFGGGHNLNIASEASEYVLILNDDLGFPHFRWLRSALSLLREEPGIACVGADENPKSISPWFGNGLLPDAFAPGKLGYAEASVLLIRRRAFDEAGGFSPDYAWAMCEDADLSFKLQQIGYRIAHVSIPHQHWRSTSFNALPGTVKSSILEHNRAAMFANWNTSLANGTPGQTEVFDLWSDGLGDVLCAMPHVLARIASLTPARRDRVLINTNHPELLELAGLGHIRRCRERDLDQLRLHAGAGGIATIRRLRDVNYSLPVNMHALIPAALGIPPADEAAFAGLAKQLRSLPLPAVPGLTPGAYCAIHAEFSRTHDGRGLAAAGVARLLQAAARRTGKIAIIGKERRIDPAALGLGSEVIDLQGRLSLSELAAVIAQAAWFAGIDSFPAHVAGAARVPAAVFFGAVHPSTRSWNERLLWPLQAPLDCLGCYHRHLEPSVPFCMRRDEACAAGPDEPALAAALRDTEAGTPYDWTGTTQRFVALQAGLLTVARHHPAPPERLFRSGLAPNEQVSNLVYQMTDKIGKLLQTQYQSVALRDAEEKVRSLQADLFTQQIALDEARGRLSVAGAGAGAPQTGAPSRIVQLALVDRETERCLVKATSQGIEVTAIGEDPQLLLTPVHGQGGRFQFRVTATADHQDHMQIYWAHDDEPFMPEQVRSVEIGREPATASLAFDLPVGTRLRLRIDPLIGAGVAKLQGSLGGSFLLAGEDGEPGQAPGDGAASTLEPAGTKPATKAPSMPRAAVP
jgi:GT2 family glycosyltransferase